jgi:hypothetical protein
MKELLHGTFSLRITDKYYQTIVAFGVTAKVAVPFAKPYCPFKL